MSERPRFRRIAIPSRSPAEGQTEPRWIEAMHEPGRETSHLDLKLNGNYSKQKLGDLNRNLPCDICSSAQMASASRLACSRAREITGSKSPRTSAKPPMKDSRASGLRLCRFWKLVSSRHSRSNWWSGLVSVGGLWIFCCWSSEFKSIRLSMSASRGSVFMFSPQAERGEGVSQLDSGGEGGKMCSSCLISSEGEGLLRLLRLS